MKKKVVSLLLAICLVAGILPLASASGTEQSGKCGPSATYTLDGNGLLTIKGTGEMDDYTSSELEKPAPWRAGSSFGTQTSVKRVVIEPGITKIGDYAFCGLSAVSSVSIPGSVTSIGTGVFQSNQSLKSIIIPSSVTELGTGSFQACWNLKEAKIYAKITELPAYTFVFCEKLQTVYLSESIIDLANNCFSNCYELRRVYTYAPDWSNIYIHEMADYNINNSEKPRGLSKAIKATATGTPTDDPGLGYVPPTASPSPDSSPSPAPENSATVVYEANGGSGYMAPQTVEVGKRYTMAECAFTPPAGKEFDCWGAKGISLVYKPGERILAAVSPGMTITYVARWKDKTSPTPGPSGDEPADQFKDVPANHYARKAINWAVTKKVVSGMTANTFGVGKKCDRSQAVFFIWAAQGRPEPTLTQNPFTDVKSGAYYYKAVLWAKEKGVTGGKTATTFDPTGDVTRGQIMTFLYAAQGRPSVSGSKTFSDVKSSDYYSKAVAWAAENGISSGKGAGTFKPKDNCKREEIVTFLYQAYK